MKSEVIQCGHCGKKAVFEVRAEVGQYGTDAEKTFDEEVTRITWRLLECTFCREPTLEQSSIHYVIRYDPATNIGKYEVSTADKTIVYPDVKMKEPLTNLPQAVEKKYLAALKVQNIEPSACAVLAGKTLEAVCNHENAQGRTLSDKLNNLVDSDRIPKTLAEMAHQLRQIRNLGAHDVDGEVTVEDVLY